MDNDQNSKVHAEPQEDESVFRERMITIEELNGVFIEKYGFYVFERNAVFGSVQPVFVSIPFKA